MAKPDGCSFLGDIETLLNRAIGEPAGTRALMEVCERHQGATVFVSSKAEIFTRWRNAHIRAEFRGDNHRELSIKWSISESQIRRILSRKE